MAMHSLTATAPLRPVAPGERIEALDVVRGFALIGILMMNVEFFNRATASLDTGIEPGLSGAHFWVSYFVQYFVTGKFWTIFSLLFGMGFAVMLMRAEQAGRSFLVPYLRRIIALAVFGAAHHIFLFAGDILFSYAIAAISLLVVLYGRARWILTTIALCIGGGIIPGMAWLFEIAGLLALLGLVAWWLRGEHRMEGFGNLPAVALILLLLGVIALVLSVVTWLEPELTPQTRVGLPLLGFALSVLGVLSARFQADRASRPWRLGVGLYVFVFFMMTAEGAATYFYPEPSVDAVISEQVEEQTEGGDERVHDATEREERVAEETAILSSGTYAEAVALRASHFPGPASDQVGFAVILVGMFLIGSWFVQSGVMKNPQAHMQLFRRLAVLALPAGVGLGLIGSAISMYEAPESRGADGFVLATGLQMLGNLPASLGYVSVVILMLYSASPLNKIRLLAPYGRMALTNYLSQSLIASTYYFGYGFGNWGASRVDQMLFVLLVVAVQILLSHAWLARFRYGPVEWLWRAATYWQIPPMRIAGQADGTGGATRM